MNHLFLDCDGVLADFDKGAEKILGVHPRKFEEEHGAKKFWKTIYSIENFFLNLEPKEDAHLLYKAVEHLKPTILTGKPRGGWAEQQKLKWRDKHFPGVPMVVCESKNKYLHMTNKGDVLVDDWLKYKHIWEENGGIFVRHFHATHTIQELQRLKPRWF